MGDIIFTETGIIAIVSILVSLISAILNIVFNIWSKKHDSKMQIVQRQFELYYAEKSRVFGEFTTNASLLHTDIHSGERYGLYYSSALKVSLLCNATSQQLIKKLLAYTNDALLNGMNVDKAWEVCYLNQVSEITVLLGEELKATSGILFTRPRRCTKWQKQPK